MSKLLYGRRFPLRVKGSVYESYVRPAILYGSEAWCLIESEMGILQRTKRYMVRAMCGVLLKNRKSSTNLMFMLSLHETMDQLAMTKSVKWVHQRSRLRKKVWRLAWEGKMYIDDQSGLLMLIRLLMDWGEFGHPHLLGILPDFRHWCLFLSLCIYICLCSIICTQACKKTHHKVHLNSYFLPK